MTQNLHKDTHSTQKKNHRKKTLNHHRQQNLHKQTTKQSQRHTNPLKGDRNYTKPLQRDIKPLQRDTKRHKTTTNTHKTSTDTNSPQRYTKCLVLACSYGPSRFTLPSFIWICLKALKTAHVLSWIKLASLITWMNTHSSSVRDWGCSTDSQRYVAAAAMKYTWKCKKTEFRVVVFVCEALNVLRAEYVWLIYAEIWGLL